VCGLEASRLADWQSMWGRLLGRRPDIQCCNCSGGQWCWYLHCPLWLLQQRGSSTDRQLAAAIRRPCHSSAHIQ